MSEPRITELLEGQALSGEDVDGVVMSRLYSINEKLDATLLELQKLNLCMALFTGHNVKDDDILSSRSDHGN